MMKMLSIILDLNFHFLKLFHLIKFILSLFIFVLDKYLLAIMMLLVTTLLKRTSYSEFLNFFLESVSRFSFCNLMVILIL